MRVGIITGSVAVTLGAVNEGMVAGDAVNTAARVQTAAEPGTVWTDQETRGLTAAAVAFSDMGEHALKGKAEPARLFRADAIVAAVGGAQRVDGLEAPLTGREAELRRVKELFHATQEDGRSRVVVVSGMAGVGKSRLRVGVREVHRRVVGPDVVAPWSLFVLRRRRGVSGRSRRWSVRGWGCWRARTGQRCRPGCASGSRRSRRTRRRRPG